MKKGVGLQSGVCAARVAQKDRKTRARAFMGTSLALFLYLRRAFQLRWVWRWRLPSAPRHEGAEPQIQSDSSTRVLHESISRSPQAAYSASVRDRICMFPPADSALLS